jgi:hypothetical protein
MVSHHVRLVSKNQRVNPVNVLLVKVLRLSKSVGTMNKRKARPEFRPGANYHKLTVWVIIFDSLSDRSGGNVLSQPAVDLKNGIL